MALIEKCAEDREDKKEDRKERSYADDKMTNKFGERNMKTRAAYLKTVARFPALH